MKDGIYSVNKRTQLIKEILTDIADIQYMNKSVVLESLTDIELQDLYSKLSKVWLIYSQHYE